MKGFWSICNYQVNASLVYGIFETGLIFDNIFATVDLTEIFHIGIIWFDITQARVEKEMENKTKLRTVRDNKRENKEYITACDSDLVKDIIKIRLHMWELKKNYPKEEEDTKCPIFNQNEDTTEHVLEF